MVKILTCGDVRGRWSILLKRLNELQASAHGPFDVLLITGRCFNAAEPYDQVASTIQLPLQTYVFNKTGFPIDLNSKGNQPLCNIENMAIVQSEDFGIVSLAHNLTVGFMSSNAKLDSSSAAMTSVRGVISSPGYRGCDILVTGEWPREMHQFLVETEVEELKICGIGIGSGSREAAKFATMLKPRYHFVPGKNAYFQRSPYANSPSDQALAAGLTVAPCTRLIAIDAVSESKEKKKKWLHAVSIAPIISMTAQELSDVPVGCTENPYVEVRSASGSSRAGKKGLESSAADGSSASKKMRFGEASIGEAAAATAVAGAVGGVGIPSAGAGSGSGAFFFGAKGRDRHGGSVGGGMVGGSLNMSAPSDSASTLFIGGLPREGDGAAGDHYGPSSSKGGGGGGANKVETELWKALPNAVTIRRPPGKAFAFVEFSSHIAAKKVVEASARRGFVIMGRTLAVGWAKEREKPPPPPSTPASTGGGGEGGGAFFEQHQQHVVYERQLVPPSAEALTLFIGGLPHSLPAVAPPSLLPTPTASTAGTGNAECDGNVAVEGSSKDAAPFDAPANGNVVNEDTIENTKSSPMETEMKSTEPETETGKEVGRKNGIDSKQDETAKAIDEEMAGGDESGARADHRNVGEEGDLKEAESTAVSAVEIASAAGAPFHNDNEELKKHLNLLFEGKVVKVFRPPGKSYAFADFDSYGSAMQVVTKSISQAVLLAGKALTIGWASGTADESTAKRFESSSRPSNGSSSSRHRGGGGDGGDAMTMVLTPPSSTSRVLFVGGLALEVTESDLLSVFASERVEVVKRPEGKPYAFVEFATHEEAAKALARGTEASSSSSSPSSAIVLYGQQLCFGWAKGKPADRAVESSECWFCLASPSVKTHLVVSIGDFSYLSMPRGGIDESHLLIIPIECVPSRVHLTAAARKEIEKYQTAVDAMYFGASTGTVAGTDENNNKSISEDGDGGGEAGASLRFERALRTKGSGRDHMQIHVIKLNKPQIDRALGCFMRKVSELRVKFHEIQDDRPIDEVVVTMAGGPYQEYFYIEIPVALNTSAVADNNNHNSSSNCSNSVEGDIAEGGGSSPSMPQQQQQQQQRVRRRRFVYVNEDDGGEVARPMNQRRGGGGGAQSSENRKEGEGEADIEEEEEGEGGKAGPALKLPMQFGVEVAADVLGCPERAHWKRCLLSEPAERKLAQQLRAQFAPYDFNR